MQNLKDNKKCSVVSLSDFEAIKIVSRTNWDRLPRLIPILIIGLMVCSCGGNTFDSEEELMTFLLEETNGYKQSKTVNGVDFSLMYRPTDLLVKQELTDSNTTKEDIKRLRDKYSKYMYFNLSMSKNNQELLSTAPRHRNEFGAMVNQLAFGMGDKVYVYTQAKDTLEMIDYIYPRMYGASHSTELMFIYKKVNEYKSSKFLTFDIKDLGLLTGDIKFKTRTDLITNEPKLQFK